MHGGCLISLLIYMVPLGQRSPNAVVEIPSALSLFPSVAQPCLALPPGTGGEAEEDLGKIHL